MDLLTIVAVVQGVISCINTIIQITREYQLVDKVIHRQVSQLELVSMSLKQNDNIYQQLAQEDNEDNNIYNNYRVTLQFHASTLKKFREVIRIILKRDLAAKFSKLKYNHKLKNKVDIAIEDIIKINTLVSQYVTKRQLTALIDNKIEKIHQIYRSDTITNEELEEEGIKILDLVDLDHNERFHVLEGKNIVLEVIKTKDIEIFEVGQRISKIALFLKEMSGKGNIFPAYGYGQIDDIHVLASIVPPNFEPLYMKLATNHNFDKLKIFQGIAKTIKFIHNYGILHKGINSFNIFIDQDNTPVLGGFACSRITQWNTIQSTDNPYYNLKRYMELYESPERKNSRCEFGRKCDIYSFGILMFEVCLNLRLIDITPELKVENCLHMVPEAFRNIIQECTHLEPHQRPSIERIQILLNDTNMVNHSN